MRFRGLDLNLLIALEALLSSRSITRAAERLHLSQPAMSAALTRLRAYFHDDLLTLEGRRFYPTPVGEALLPLVRNWLRSAEGIISASQGFDPATSHRRFRIIASDYTATILLTRVAAAVSAMAPHIIIDIVTPQDDGSARLQEMEVDLVIGPELFLLAEHPSDLLFEERMVAVGWSKNPALKALSREAFESAGHVVATFGPQRLPAYGDQQLDAIGAKRRVEVRASSFSLLPWFLPGTRRLAIMHERLAIFFAGMADLDIAELPYDLPKMQVFLQYHRARRDDAGLRWIRDQIMTAVSDESFDPSAAL